MIGLSVGQVNSWRLQNHHLTNRAAKEGLSKVVSDVCGIQAQVLSAAELAVRARVVEARQEDVRAALWKDRTVVKTWCMRGTLHLLASSDLSLYVAALSSKLDGTLRWLEREGGVTPTEVAAITRMIDRSLSDEPMTREELSRAIERGTTLSARTRRTLRSAWGVLLRPAAYRGLLAFGESVGPKATFVKPPQEVKPPKKVAGDSSLRELFRRFLHSYGPAGVGDFGHWWGSLREVKPALDRFIEEFEQVQLDGLRGLMLSHDAEEADGLEPARR